MAASPLCHPDYLQPAGRRGHSRAPWWMRSLLSLAAALVAAVTLLTLTGPMDETVLAAGEVRPASYVLVFPRVPGVIEDFKVREGGAVKAGQVLATFDSWGIAKERERLAGELAQAQAELARAKAARQRAEAAPVPAEFLFGAAEVDRQKQAIGLQRDLLRRLEELQRQGGASEVQLVSQRLQLLAAESQMARTERAAEAMAEGLGEAALAEARAREDGAAARIADLEARRHQLDGDLERHRVVSPVDGVVLSASARFVGEKVEVGQPMFKIAVGERRVLRLFASEDRINDVRPGQDVRFRSRSDPDRLSPPMKGKVAEVAIDRELGDRLRTEAAAAGKTYRIEVALGEAGASLPFGSRVDAEIILRTRPFWRVLMLKPAPPAATTPTSE